MEGILDTLNDAAAAALAKTPDLRHRLELFDRYLAKSRARQRASNDLARSSGDRIRDRRAELAEEERRYASSGLALPDAVRKDCENAIERARRDHDAARAEAEAELAKLGGLTRHGETMADILNRWARNGL